MVKIYKASDFFGVTNSVYKIAGWNYNLNSVDLKKKFFQEFYYWLLNTLCIIMILQSLVYLFDNIGNPGKFLDMTELILIIGFLVMLLMKSYFVVYRNREILTEMIDDLDEVVPKVEHVQVKFNIEAYYKKIRAVSIATSITYSSLLIIFNIMPILEKITGLILGIEVEWELPYKIYFPFDATQDYVYPLMFIYEIWMSSKCAIEVLGSDLLFCNITSLVTMRLEMMRQEIIEIDVENHEKSLESLKDFVKVHQHLKKIVDKLENIYSISLLGDLLASTIITCLAAFNAFLGVKGVPLLKFIICFFTSLLRTGFQCLHVDQMTRASLHLADGAYDNLWYNGSVKFKKTLLTIIMRSQKPFVITSYKFQNLSLESYTDFIRASYSLFALLQTMYRNDA